MPYPGHRYTDDGVPRVLLPELARLLRRRRDQLDIGHGDLALMVGIHPSNLSEALNPERAPPLSLHRYGILAESLGLSPAGDFRRRCEEMSAAAACRDLAVRARAALGLDRPPELPPHTPVPFSKRALVSREREAIRLARDGFTAEALARFTDLGADAALAGNRRAVWMNGCNRGQVLVMLSRLEEAEAAFAAVRASAEDAGDQPHAALAAVLEAGALYELGRYGRALNTLRDAEARLRDVLPLEEVLAGGPLPRQPVPRLWTHDATPSPGLLWWTARHLGAKVRIEQGLLGQAGRRAAAQGAAASRAAREGLRLARRLGLPSVGHDLLWLARALRLEGTAAAWGEARRLEEEAEEHTRYGLNLAYRRRAAGLRRALGDAVDSEERAASILLDAADIFAAHGDARGLGPTLSEAAVQTALQAEGAADPERGALQGAAARLALAAAALHPYGVVRHQVQELLAGPVVGGRSTAELRVDAADLLEFRGEPFAQLRDLARHLWAERASETMRRNLASLAPAAPRARGASIRAALGASAPDAGRR